jgi:hypothetical protein
MKLSINPIIYLHTGLQPGAWGDKSVLVPSTRCVSFAHVNGGDNSGAAAVQLYVCGSRSFSNADDLFPDKTDSQWTSQLGS